jgi:hypothetical protein
MNNCGNRSALSYFIGFLLPIAKMLPKAKNLDNFAGMFEAI